MSGRSGLQKEGFILTCSSEDKVHHSGEGMAGGGGQLRSKDREAREPKQMGQKTGLDHNPPGATPVIGGPPVMSHSFPEQRPRGTSRI